MNNTYLQLEVVAVQSNPSLYFVAFTVSNTSISCLHHLEIFSVYHLTFSSFCIRTTEGRQFCTTLLLLLSWQFNFFNQSFLKFIISRCTKPPWACRDVRHGRPPRGPPPRPAGRTAPQGLSPVSHAFDDIIRRCIK